MYKINDSIYISLNNNSLIIANTGKPFDKKGVLSICYSNLSSKNKKTKISVDQYLNTKDNEFIELIKKEQIKKYIDYPNDLAEDSNNEKEKKLDYQGRYLLELLQNADDAMGNPNTSLGEIGSKGIGFKSILEISDEPEIFSNNYNFKFSNKLSFDELEKNGVSNPPELTFRIPHKCYPDEQIQSLLKNFTTVIRLKIKKEKIQMIKEELNDFDKCCLLFVQNIKNLSIKIYDKLNIYKIEGSTSPLDEKVLNLYSKINEKEKNEKWKRWSIVWTNKKEEDKKQSICIALPLENNKVQPTQESENLYVYFKTKVNTYCKALIHCSFDTTSNRNDIRFRDEFTEIDDEILDKLCNKITSILLEIPSEIAIQVFNLLNLNNFSKISKKAELYKKLLNGIFNTVDNTSFIPTEVNGKKRIREIRLIDRDIIKLLNFDNKEIQDLNNISSELINYYKIFHDHGIEYINNPADLLIYCKNNSLKECLNVLKYIDNQTYNYVFNNNSLEEIPFWFTENENARSLNEDKPFLFENLDLPQWLKNNYDCLHQEFKKNFIQLIKNNKNLRHHKEDILLKFIDKKNVFTNLICKDLYEWSDKRWEKHGYDFLELYEKYCQKEYYYDQEFQFIKIPTYVGWQNPKDCYADLRLNINKSLKEYLDKKENRYLVLPFNKWKNSKKSNKNFWLKNLQEIGVSFGPKITKFDDNNREILKYTYTDINENYTLNDLWQKGKGDLYFYQDHFIEDFPLPILYILSHKDRGLLFEILKNLFNEMKEFFDQKDYRRQRNGNIYDYSYGRVDDQYESFLKYQFYNTKIIPTKKCLFNSNTFSLPTEAYINAEGLNDILPEIDIHHYEIGKYTKFFNNLKINRKLPNDFDKWKDILYKFGKLSPNNYQLAIKLYNKFLSQKKFKNENISTHWGSRTKFPCFENVDKKNKKIKYESHDKIYFIDQASIDKEIINKLIKSGLNIFIIPLNINISKFLSFNKLSLLLNYKYNISQHIDFNLSKQYSKNYKKLYPYLNAVADLLSDENKLLKNITIKISKNIIRLIKFDIKENIITQEDSIPYYYNNKKKMIFLSNEFDMLESLSECLSENFADKKVLHSFEKLLKCSNSRKLINILKSVGISPEILDLYKSKINNTNWEPFNNQSANNEIDDPNPNIDGIKAQKSLFHLISKKFRNTNWEVEEEKEYKINKMKTRIDIQISKGEKKYFIECKLKNIIWKNSQINFAKENKGKYFIAYLDDPDELNIKWFFDPLNELAIPGRTIHGKSSGKIYDNNWGSFEEIERNLIKEKWDIKIPSKIIPIKKIDNDLKLLFKKINT